MNVNLLYEPIQMKMKMVLDSVPLSLQVLILIFLINLRIDFILFFCFLLLLKNNIFGVINEDKISIKFLSKSNHTCYIHILQTQKSSSAD